MLFVGRPAEPQLAVGAVPTRSILLSPELHDHAPIFMVGKIADGPVFTRCEVECDGSPLPWVQAAISFPDD